MLGKKGTTATRDHPVVVQKIVGKMKTIRAICLDCSKMQRGKELKIITTTAQLSLHAKYNPTHRVEIISAVDYDRKTGFVLRQDKNE